MLNSNQEPDPHGLLAEDLARCVTVHHDARITADALASRAAVYTQLLVTDYDNPTYRDAVERAIGDWTAADANRARAMARLDAAQSAYRTAHGLDVEE